MDFGHLQGKRGPEGSRRKKRKTSTSFRRNTDADPLNPNEPGRSPLRAPKLLLFKKELPTMTNSLLRRSLATTALFVACALGATAASAKDGRSGKDRGARMFERVDANNDGKITKAESSQAADARFSKMDANDDGVVTQEEAKARHASRRDARSEKREKRGDKRRTRKGNRRDRKAGQFAKLDTNSDGKITRTEAKSSEARRFARLDTNNDGAITLEEMKAARKNRRGNRNRNKQACGERKGSDDDATRTAAA